MSERAPIAIEGAASISYMLRRCSWIRIVCYKSTIGAHMAKYVAGSSERSRTGFLWLSTPFGLIEYASYRRARPIYRRARPMFGRSGDTETMRVRLEQDDTMVRILPDGRTVQITPRVDREKLDATTEEDIARQEAEDDAALVSDIRKSATISSASMQAIVGRIGKTPHDLRRCVTHPGSDGKVRGRRRCQGKLRGARPKRCCQEFRVGKLREEVRPTSAPGVAEGGGSLMGGKVKDHG